MLKPPELPPPQPVKIAVVLGAGASKGFAHIGVLKVLEAHKIPVHMIVGTSAGSLVGSLYASGKNAFELQDIAMRMETDKVIDYDWRVWKGGLIKGEKIEKFVNDHVKAAPIEKLKIRFLPLLPILQPVRKLFSDVATPAWPSAQVVLYQVFSSPSGSEIQPMWTEGSSVRLP